MNRHKIAKELVRLARELIVAKSMYEDTINGLLRQLRRTDIDPRHVEGYLRLDFGTLDHLSRGRFLKEMREIIPAIDADPKGAESLARSYGL